MSPTEILNKKKRLIGSVTVAIILLMSSFAVFMILPQNTNTVQAASTTDFDNYKSVTIESDYVGGTLTNFPVWVYRSSDSNLVGSASEDIAFFSSDNNTQYNHEIEIFNTGTGEIGAWVNVTSISSTVDTSFWMYYNDSDSTTEENIADTWDDNYVLVLHMDDYSTSQVNDSSGYTNHGDKSSDQANGKMGYGQTFTASNNDIIDCGHDSELDLSGSDDFTVELWQKNIMTTSGKWVSKDGPTNRCWYFDQLGSDHSPRVYLNDGSSGQTLTSLGSVTTNDGAWWYVSVQVHMSGASEYLRYIGNKGSGFDYQHSTITLDTLNTGASANDMYLGCRMDESGDFFDGTMDEVRISNIERGNDWIKATYNTSSSPSTFLSFGTEHGGAASEDSSFSLSGYDGNGRITWSGQAGETVWSNQTSYGTLTIQTNISPDDNCTAIYIDIADFASVIDADNISVEVRNTADGTFDGTTVALGSSPNYNLTIDHSAGAWFQGTNPFPIDGGSSWENVTLEARFKCIIPGDAAVGTYLNTSTSWNVKWKIIS